MNDAASKRLPLVLVVLFSWLMYVVAPILFQARGVFQIHHMPAFIILSTISIAILSLKIFLDEYATGRFTLIDHGLRLTWIGTAGMMGLGGAQFLSSDAIVTANILGQPGLAADGLRFNSLAILLVGGVVGLAASSMAALNAREARILNQQDAIVWNLLNLALGLFIYSAYFSALISRTV